MTDTTQPLARARPVRAEPDRAPPHRRRPYRAFQLAAGARPGAREAGTYLPAPHRGHRSQPLRRRSRAGIVDILRWFGLDWDEGPDIGGRLGPYRQSERTDLYREHAARLLESGHAYRCFCTPERLQRVREEQTARKEAPGYDRFCRDLTPRQVQANLAAGMPSSIRFRMPLDGETPVLDLLRGEIIFQNANLEDLILLKSDGYPTYHLANVVDDHLMEISHILRGEEWIPTAPIHVRLYDAFGWDAPQFAHMPLILHLAAASSPSGTARRRWRSSGRRATCPRR